MVRAVHDLFANDGSCAPASIPTKRTVASRRSRFRDLTHLDKAVAIGETGPTAAGWPGELAEMEWQRERFRVHPRRSRPQTPLVIHTRSAGDTLRLIREDQAARPAVSSIASPRRPKSRAALDLGFHISFSGILTFKNASDLRDVAAFVPLDRCLIETDSPYLAPMPFQARSTRQPMPLVARQLALKIVAVEETPATSHNFARPS
jgi:TatD DNase family protein